MKYYAYEAKVLHHISNWIVHSICYVLNIIVLFFIQHIPNLVTGIHTIGQRVIISDVQESLFWVRYRRNENQLIIFADDTYPRWVTTACLLDYDTMASADKFGNISIVSFVF